MTAIEDDLKARSRAELLQARLRGSTTLAQPRPRISRRVQVGPAPLSSAQLQLWYLHQLAPGSIAYNELITVRKDGSFDAAAFTWAFNEVIRRHEAWRTTFAIIGDEPCQIVEDHQPVELPVLDLSYLSLVDAEAEAAHVAADITSAPYDLTSGPMLRPVVIKLSATHHRLYLAIHHLIFDGVSLYRILLPELVALYDAHHAGKASPLPEPTVQYSDYAVWERNWLQSSEFERRIERCRARLHGIEPLKLPADHPRPARQRFHGSTVPIGIDYSVARQLQTVAADHDATLFQMVAAVHAYWLRGYTEHDEVVFATPHDLRQAPELETMMGSCVTPVVLRVDVPETATAVDLLARMRTAVLDAIGCAVPFEPLVRAIDPPRDQRRNPLFQSALVFQPASVTTDPTWSIQPMEAAVSDLLGQSKFDISIELDVRNDGRLGGRLIYDTDLFDIGTAELMALQFTRLLDNVASAPDLPLAQLARAGEDDLRRQLDEFNPRPLPCLPDVGRRCIQQLIIDRATRTPDAVAVEVGHERLSYRELLARSESIAERLLDAGAGRGVVVATRLDRSIELVPALLGVLRAGSAYLPLDPNQPHSRSQFMLSDAGATVLLTDSSRMPPLPTGELPVVDLARNPAPPRNCPAPPRIPAHSDPRDRAYVIYTSGSTGTPKGVEVEHSNVVNLMSALPAVLGLSSSDRVLSVASSSFDMSVGDIFPTLARGATLVLATDAETQDPRALGELIQRCDATVMGATPTTWSMLLAAGWSGHPGLLAVCGGEPLSERLADELRQRCRGVWNGWGPTETTVYAGGGFVDAGTPITVGRPLPGVRIYVLDKLGRITPCGVPGEIVVAGRGVSSGYVNRPDESARRYRPDPFVGGDRMYHTGDRGRLLDDGRLQHLGRYDDQVKVRGFRIEPGEVEAVLVQHPDVAEVAVTAHHDAAGHLVAHVVVNAQGANDIALRRWAAGRLPTYMVPTVIVRVAALPMSPSGKLDRSALPAPPSTAALPPAQRTSTKTERRLIQIWSELLPGSDGDPDLDFFELGGHSVLAARLLAEVQRRLNISVSVADFLDHGTTLAGLAQLVDQTRIDGAAAAGPVGARPMLFFVYPDQASSMSLRHLSAVWEDEHLVHPLITPPVGGRLGRAATVEDMAKLLLRAVRKAQPRGPYRLIGYSFGGLLSYELARLLRADGEHVAWLGLLDTPTPAVVRQLVRKWKSPSARIARLRESHRSRLIGEYVQNLRWSAREKLISAGLAQRRAGEQFDIRDAWQLMLDCTTEGHDVPMNLFVTNGTVDETGCDTLGWGRLHRGPLEVHAAPGDHDSLIGESLAAEVTALVSASLRDTARESTP